MSRAAASQRTRHLPLRQLLGRLFILSGLIVVAAALAGAVSFVHLNDERSTVIDRLDPATALTSQLLAAYLDQETAVRGYVLTREPLFLQPYQAGTQAAAAADAQLARLLPPGGRSAGLRSTVTDRATAWRTRFAEPAVAAVAAGDRRFEGTAELTAGKDMFDSLRSSITALQKQLAAEQAAARHRLAASTDELATVMIVSLAVLVLNGIIIWVALRRSVLQPLAAMAADTRLVSSGQLDHRVQPAGPREIAELAADIEAMRTRIFEEVETARAAEAQLSATNADLRRSNEDLEQFAYVASHDLQEPLRKVTSFCQLLEQRYSGQLDDRGEQYIRFAVDGAKRMQVLINDLLAFSRIGRTTDRFEPVDLGECLQLAERNLTGAIEAQGATVTAGDPLPTVPGDRTLLVALLQNLVGNAIKFRGEEPPAVQVTATVADDEWLVSVTDNGIGIEPRFAERIFVIFQRLHGRDAYSGTGIGLALCRKIVEFHGGRIWLDVDHHPGTRFCFTLPLLRTEEEPNELDHPAVHAG